ncbi:MarR family winged helix-turn-helix transcriptional regulator [Streptomyces spectabilis]|uniref:MarR family winged helix-turn-helix transcriptional regulator n=1 Tax=Streptomyces spectabilis TaxID=68270 RepID=UPI0033ED9236
MGDSGWLSDEQQRAWRSFVSMHTALLTRLNAHLQDEGGLSSPDHQILVALSEAPRGRARATALGRETGWEKSRLSHHLSRMERRGLLRREASAEDSRYADVVLTDTGRAAIEAAAPRHVAHVREWFVDAMTPEQLAAFGDLCDAVAAKVRTPADGPCRIGFEPTGA